MARRAAAGKKEPGKGNGNGANLGFEEKLWQSADKLRGNLDAAEYKHVVLGFIFLKYISDAFESRRAQLEALCDDPETARLMITKGWQERLLITIWHFVIHKCVCRQPAHNKWTGSIRRKVLSENDS